ncbi:MULTISPECIES: pyocin knob domain-containing protein [Paenibacillus]|uniref:pyocin knob domain-containing protein n=1 Tax=Paenibacillus TaxID=44249 RepID=UPI000CFB7B33|nr:MULTISPECIES: pyocin knob domain-containing protein [unclassified Paenibacillus]KAA8747309.1 hypothetical protein FE296_24370 [Paenibacillus sp. UASWS1643]PRA02556.1 hypothetical protein CQ043_20905 [Paenibacillus sp. MYb63]PRA45362.1 hypothetical protein CQ061_20865 [Paenibacillus sp. MYb67]QZN78266.1 pyocin knob domain-containing protein [Paenibacillus sp. DR312]
MNEPKTPNLGLNKIDRSSPSTTYFDLDKYLDQNWEKVDEGVATRDEVEELRQSVNEMDIPDASLTQKGKVQLSSKTNGISEEFAPTEKALNDARLAAQKYTDDKTWQKYKLTQDNGEPTLIAANYDLNTLKATGVYGCQNAVNAPLVSRAWEIRVVRSVSLDSIIQEVTSYTTGTDTQVMKYIRKTQNASANPSTWTAWQLMTPQPNVWGAL